MYLQSPAAFHSHFAITSLFCFLRGGEYKAFPKSHALRDQLTWTHYRLLMKVENEKARQFYLEELRQELQREYQVLDDVMQNEAGGVTIFRLPLQDWYRNLLPPGSRKY